MGVLDNKKVAVVFPGQGSQTVGMGLSLAENFPVAAEIYEKADQLLGFALSDLCFKGPEEELTQTVNTQPALYVSSVAAYEVAKLQGFSAAFSAGHSVGEYAALYAAGAISFEDGLKLVRKRAELMNRSANATAGAMAAILGLPPSKVEEAVQLASDAGIVVAANFNSPIQTVISGETAAVEKAGVCAKSIGAKRIVPLKVSGAFHSPLMQSAADAMRKVLEECVIVDAKIPVAANITGDLECCANNIKENLARQIVGTVRWIGCVEKLVQSGTEVFVELGSGNVIAGLVKKIVPQLEVYSAGDKPSIEALFD